MTEDQAKTKWCPFSRIGTSGGDGSNRWIESAGEDATTAANYKPVLCIASACMAWRTATNPGVEWHPFVSDQSPGAGWYWSDIEKQWWRADQKPFGYCGLAGAPQ